MNTPTIQPIPKPTAEQRLAFVKALYLSGRLHDGTPERCGGCGRVLVYRALVAVELLQDGIPATANRCACGLVTVPAGWAS